MAPKQSEEVAVTRPSFWVIADDLAAYVETLSMVEADLAQAHNECEADSLKEQRGEVLDSIERLGAELATKTDSIAGVLRRLDADAAMQREEAERMAAKAKASERAIEWLKAYTIRVMDEHGWKHLKTAKNTLTIRGNGGVAPLVIDSPEQIPDAQCWMEGKVRADLWKHVVATFPWLDFKRVPSNTLIREAMAGECKRCGGRGQEADYVGLEMRPVGVDCEACGGTGRATVPGAHLTERGRHLRCS